MSLLLYRKRQMWIKIYKKQKKPNLTFGMSLGRPKIGKQALFVIIKSLCKWFNTAILSSHRIYYL